MYAEKRTAPGRDEFFVLLSSAADWSSAGAARRAH
jgi:hypothetical protein